MVDFGRRTMPVRPTVDGGPCRRDRFHRAPRGRIYRAHAAAHGRLRHRVCLYRQHVPQSDGGSVGAGIGCRAIKLRHRRGGRPRPDILTRAPAARTLSGVVPTVARCRPGFQCTIRPMPEKPLNSSPRHSRMMNRLGMRTFCSTARRKQKAPSISLLA